MKLHLLRLFISLAVVCLVHAFTQPLLAGPVTARDSLISAYATLERADHDYKGHRKEAMLQIEAAAKELGINVRGDGKGREKQGVSDEQLRAARKMLEDSRAELHGRPLKHVNRAIEQISVALKIK